MCEETNMPNKIDIPSWEYPVPEGRAMNMVWSRKEGDDKIYYVILGEDFLRDTCQQCKNILNMEFGWKSQQGMPLFVCTNIAQLKPTIEHPIE
ncbi:unnamed protein product, partial [marine sediment metagenome]